MRRIDERTAATIEAFLAESDYDLPAYALEKDYHVVSAIRVLANIPKNKHFNLVFCGGTCLSKAYGILERMSEDVDFKVVPTADGAALTKSELRNKLSKFRAEIIEALGGAGFGSENIAKRVRDEGKYTALTIGYESLFEKAESLRSELMIELNFTEMANPSDKREIGLLYEKLADLKNSSPLSIACVSMREAFAEKLISFPRRLALHMGRTDPEDASKWDKALVRHLYDIHLIKSKHPEIEGDPIALSQVLLSVIEKDAADFANQHDGFLADPKGELLKAMEHAKSNSEIRVQYDSFVRDMVYAPPETIPSFDEAIEGFLGSLIQALPPKINLQNLADRRSAASRQNFGGLEP